MISAKPVLSHQQPFISFSAHRFVLISNSYLLFVYLLNIFNFNQNNHLMRFFFFSNKKKRLASSVVIKKNKQFSYLKKNIYLNFKLNLYSRKYFSKNTSNAVPQFHNALSHNLFSKMNMCKHYLSHSYFLFDKHFILLGQLISPYNWHFENKKKWLRLFMLENFIKKNNYNDKTLQTSKLLYKNIYFENYCYFSKFKIKFVDFKYFMKIFNLKIKITNESNYFLTKPYNILSGNRQNFSKFNPYILIMHSLFKQYQKINQFSLKFVKSFKSKFFFNTNVFTYFYKKPYFVNPTISHRLPQSTSILALKLKTKNKRIRPLRTKTKNFYLSFFLNKNKNKTFYSKSVNNLKFFLNIKKLEKNFKITNFKFFLNAQNRDFSVFNRVLPLYFYSFSIFFYYINNRFLSVKSKVFNPWNCFGFSSFICNYDLLKPTLRFENAALFFKKKKKMITFKQRPKFKNVRQLNNIFYKLKHSIVFSFYKLPFFSSKHDNNFILNGFGFIYITEGFLNNFSTDFYSYTVKKKYFSFALKNDTQKYIIKRYIKSTSVFYTNKANKSKKLNFVSNLENNYFLFEKNLLNFKSNLSNLGSFLANHPHLSSLDWKDQISESVDIENTNFNFFIKKIKFKPGYMTFWREARTIFKEILNLNIKYQHRLTKYLIKFNKILKFNLYINTEMSFRNIIQRSRFFFDWNTSEFFLNKGVFFINGTSCYNKTTQLYAGDLIQMIIHAKYYIFYKWLSHWITKKKLKLKLKTKKKLTILTTDEDKTRTKVFPKWILFDRNLNDDCAKFLEIDFFTLSIFVVYEPFTWRDLNTYSTLWTRYSVINMYNWKYIT